jgi:hypothetical protein
VRPKRIADNGYVKALNLNATRLRAVGFEKPGVDRKVLHDMIMSMRVNFEASL